MADAVYGDNPIDTPVGFPPVTLDLSEYVTLAANVDALLDRLDLVFMHGTMDTATRAAIRAAIEPVNTDMRARTQLALYLVLISPAAAVSS